MQLPREILEKIKNGGKTEIPKPQDKVIGLAIITINGENACVINANYVELIKASKANGLIVLDAILPYIHIGYFSFEGNPTSENDFKIKLEGIRKRYGDKIKIVYDYGVYSVGNFGSDEVGYKYSVYGPKVKTMINESNSLKWNNCVKQGCV